VAVDSSGHAVHKSNAVAPRVAENVPAEHFKQSPSSTLPSTGRYFPAPHWKHAEIVTAPRVPENLPLLQSKQSVAMLAPTDAEYFPAAHFTHVVLD